MNNSKYRQRNYRARLELEHSIWHYIERIENEPDETYWTGKEDSRLVQLKKLVREYFALNKNKKGKKK